MNTEHVWYACNEHIDIILDEIVDDTSLAPEMELYRGDDNEAKCGWCGNRPAYRLWVNPGE
ncbi:MULTISPECIES: CxxH/CxxC protein [Thermoactinomyces]|jgi:CxxH/CxxC protein (TIGR04129 family)|uniref:CxxH/CxxC protein n=1 Tax=Thermoactinomyces daqus TaxID=1329516 RepID=A0A7W1X8B2_9BACL|nr:MULTISPECIES: CxxH/CxxC protein [Thermoactinomyces]MBA4541910.1 CxxH/CxxC protein [Thermoactinomyces daqus]MBH8607717.1 CxxH/CxxC protein [Thermoactinomyces sp. CICC 10521]